MKLNIAALVLVSAMCAANAMPAHDSRAESGDLEKQLDGLDGLDNMDAPVAPRNRGPTDFDDEVLSASDYDFPEEQELDDDAAFAEDDEEQADFPDAENQDDADDDFDDPKDSSGAAGEVPEDTEEPAPKKTKPETPESEQQPKPAEHGEKKDKDTPSEGAIATPDDKDEQKDKDTPSEGASAKPDDKDDKKPADSSNNFGFKPSAVFAKGIKFAIKGGRSKQFCADDQGHLICNRQSIGPWETFTVADGAGNATWFRSGHSNKFCSDQQSKLVCDRDHNGDWEKFLVEPLGENKYAIRGRQPTYYYCAENPQNTIVCDRPSRDEHGAFEVVSLGN